MFSACCRIRNKDSMDMHCIHVKTRCCCIHSSWQGKVATADVSQAASPGKGKSRLEVFACRFETADSDSAERCG